MSFFVLLQFKDRYGTILTIKDKSIDGLEPEMAGWKAQTNPLSYSGTLFKIYILKYWRGYYNSFFNPHPPPLCGCYTVTNANAPGLFQTNNTMVTANYCEKCPSIQCLSGAVIRTHDLLNTSHNPNH